jgi:hypothetical protein
MGCGPPEDEVRRPARIPNRQHLGGHPTHGEAHHGQPTDTEDVEGAGDVVCEVGDLEPAPDAVRLPVIPQVEDDHPVTLRQGGHDPMPREESVV